AMHNGRILRIYGSRTPGLLDGMGQEAAFTEPQGMSFSDNCLYVADTGNHAIRRIDVTTEEVLTIAGTGEQGRLREGSFQEPAAVPLNSP
ncbi:MAG: thiol-disulfide isomerase, partial [Desulfuromonadales bacterium]|nr:thiol-disulfide isomerase [Desulfuromonadales bacterium]